MPRSLVHTPNNLLSQRKSRRLKYFGTEVHTDVHRWYSSTFPKPFFQAKARFGLILAQGWIDLRAYHLCAKTARPA